MSQSNKEEPTKIVLRQSWKSFAFGWMVVGLSLIAAAIPGTLLDLYHQYTGQAVSEVFGLAPNLLLLYTGLITAAFAFSVQIAYPLLANEYLLTDDEIVETFGLIQKRTRITKLAHIRSVNVNITFVGRILGYGDVFYYTAGSDDVDVTLHNIANPTETADLIKEMTEKAASAEKQLKQAESGLGGASTEVLYDVADRIIAAFEAVAQAQREQQRGFDSMTRQIRDSLDRIEKSVSLIASRAGQEHPDSGVANVPMLEVPTAHPSNKQSEQGIDASWSEDDLDEDFEEPTYHANLDDIIGKQSAESAPHQTPAEPDPAIQKPTSVPELDLSPGPKRPPKRHIPNEPVPEASPEKSLEAAPSVSSSHTEPTSEHSASQPGDRDAAEHDEQEPGKTPDETWSPALRGVRCEVSGYYTED